MTTDEKTTGVVHLGDSAQFDALIAQGVTLIDCYADWCGPCRMLTPIMEELASDYAGRAQIVKIDVDAHGEIAQRLGVSSIPAVFVFRDGEPVGDMIVGAHPKEHYAGVLDGLLHEGADE